MSVLKSILLYPAISSLHYRAARLLMESFRSKTVNQFLFRFGKFLPEDILTMKAPLDSSITVSYRIDPYSYIGKRIFYRLYEPEVTEFLVQILHRYGTVWDVGANVGYYTVIAGVKLKDRGRVYSFEPIPVNFRFLEENITLNGLTNVTAFNIALGEQEGSAEMYLLSRERTSATPTLNAGWAAQSGLDQHITVQMRNAMAMIEHGEIERPDLIKIDAETFEPIILGTIKGLLTEKDAPDILLELMPPSIESLTSLLLEECGYRCYHIAPCMTREIRELKMRRPHNDYFFTKLHPPASKH